ncbi:MAG: GNAT family N-acetyltransferase [Chloroflexota bacterium]
MSNDQTTPQISLRRVVPSDLPIFFEQQLDADANFMAAFTAKDPADRDAFMARWTMMQADEATHIRTIEWGQEVAGNIFRYEEMGRREVSYWLGNAYWGRGIATQALALFLVELPERPLYARVATDNIGSLRVLQKCGFQVIDKDKGFANARGTEVEEYVLVLESN